MKLKDIATGTEFTVNGYIFRKENSSWGRPEKGVSECTPEIEGKPCWKVTPKMGGQFQPKMSKWMNEETEVSVSSDRY